MRHQVRKPKLNKDAAHRNAMLKNLASSVIQYENINTTKAKAKVVMGLVDRLINAGKSKDVTARRFLNKELGNELATRKILEVLADRFKDKKSGYTSVVKLGKRKGDDAEIVRVMLLEE